MTPGEVMMQRVKEQRKEGQPEAAEESYGQAAELASADGSARLRAHALRHVAELAAIAGKGRRALEAADEALAIYQSDPDELPLNVANAHRVRALALSSMGRAKQSAQEWAEARALYLDLGIAAGVAECDRRLASG